MAIPLISLASDMPGSAITKNDPAERLQNTSDPEEITGKDPADKQKSIDKKKKSAFRTVLGKITSGEQTKPEAKPAQSTAAAAYNPATTVGNKETSLAALQQQEDLKIINETKNRVKDPHVQANNAQEIGSEHAAIQLDKELFAIEADEDIKPKGQVVNDMLAQIGTDIMPAVDKLQVLPLTGSALQTPVIDTSLNINHSSGVQPDSGMAYSTINTNNQGWEQELGHRIFWMLDKGTQKITLQTSPSELGPLGIQLDLRDSTTNVIFTSHNPDMRGIIEGTTHKLHGMFDAQGLNLGQVQVNISTNQFDSNNRGLPYQLGHTQLPIHSGEIKNLSALDGHVLSGRSNWRCLIDYYV